jgi:hypothetical protein
VNWSKQEELLNLIEKAKLKCIFFNYSIKITFKISHSKKTNMLDCEIVLQELSNTKPEGVELSEDQEVEDLGSPVDQEFSDDEYGFSLIPDHILIQALSYLDIQDTVSASLTCKRWFSIAQDDLLWRDHLWRDFNVAGIARKPGIPYKLIS